MKKCIILLPTYFNDGTEVPVSVISEILREIDDEFDGHTIGGKVEGAYRMETGEMANDVSLEVWIAVESERLDVLKKMAGHFARMLKQETIYFEETNSRIEFIEPKEESEGA